MKQYLLSVYQPDGDPPPPEFLEPRHAQRPRADRGASGGRDVGVSAGLHPASTATVVHLRDGQLETTDGPYGEGKEHIGGFTIIKAPDPHAALHWARRYAEVITLPIEVRPLQGEA